MFNWNRKCNYVSKMSLKINTQLAMKIKWTQYAYNILSRVVSPLADGPCYAGNLYITQFTSYWLCSVNNQGINSYELIELSHNVRPSAPEDVRNKLQQNVHLLITFQLHIQIRARSSSLLYRSVIVVTDLTTTSYPGMKQQHPVMPLVDILSPWKPNRNSMALWRGTHQVIGTRGVA